MLLRGAALRRLCSLAVRPFSTALDPSTSQEPARPVGSSSDVIRHVSFREANRSRTRARVEGQLQSFLRSRELRT